MFRRFAVALALVATVAVPGLAADVTGKWQGTVQGDQGEFTLMFDFTVDGETLGGTVDGPGGRLPITKGTIKGDDLTFNVDLDAGTTITHEAKATGETIVVKATGPWGTSEYTLKRTDKQE